MLLILTEILQNVLLVKGSLQHERKIYNAFNEKSLAFLLKKKTVINPVKLDLKKNKLTILFFD